MARSTEPDHRVYLGGRTGGRVSVTVDRQPLDPRLDLVNHSPTGFEWGYAGSGPSQLALALLADALGNDARALTLYQSFKFEFIVGITSDVWTMTRKEIRDWARDFQKRLVEDPGPDGLASAGTGDVR